MIESTYPLYIVPPKPGNETTFSLADLSLNQPKPAAAAHFDASAEQPFLLPCPFCGRVALPLTYVDDIFRVECVGCGAETAPQETESAAISAWNQRIHQSADLKEALRIVGIQHERAAAQRKLVANLRTKIVQLIDKQEKS